MQTQDVGPHRDRDAAVDHASRPGRRARAHAAQLLGVFS